jgi:hypothetical protein
MFAIDSAVEHVAAGWKRSTGRSTCDGWCAERGSAAHGDSTRVYQRGSISVNVSCSRRRHCTASRRPEPIGSCDGATKVAIP